MNDSNICTNFHEIRPNVRKLSENSQKKSSFIMFNNCSDRLTPTEQNDSYFDKLTE